MIGDGAAGARAMHRTGGAILMQSPETSDYPSVPEAALAAVSDGIAVPLDDLAGRIHDLTGTPCSERGEVPWDIGIELKIAGMEGATMANEERLGELSPYTCPHCSGVLWEIEDGPLKRFRCHTGHAYTIEALSESQERALDKSLFNALRAHRGRATLTRQMASTTSNDENRGRLKIRAGKYEKDADYLAAMIRQRDETGGRPHPASDFS